MNPKTFITKKWSGKVAAGALIVGALFYLNGFLGLDLADPFFDHLEALVGTAGNFTSESNLGTVHSVVVKYCKTPTSPKGDYLIYEIHCSYREFVFRCPVGNLYFGKIPAVDNIQNAVNLWRDSIRHHNDGTIAMRAVVCIMDGDAERERDLFGRPAHGLMLETYHESGNDRGQLRNYGWAFLGPQIPEITGELDSVQTLGTVAIEGPGIRRRIHINRNIYQGP